MTVPSGDRSPRWQLLLGALALLVAAVGTLATYDETPKSTQPKQTEQTRAQTGAWVSSPTDPARRLHRLAEQDQDEPTARVRVDPADRRQAWRGVGAAMTDASVELLAAAPDAVRALFDPGADDGARLSWVRLPLTSTDMSPAAWTWGWDGKVASPAPQARAAIEMVARAAKLQPDLRVVAVPWTAPTWMKQPADVRGGALRDDHVDDYAALLVAQVDRLRDDGVPVAALSLGNEPGFSADYPSMTMTDQQQSYLARSVSPELRKRGVELWAVDHNWADRSRYDAVLAGAPGAFAAAAFHCYAGRAGQMAGVGVPPIVDECTGTRSSWGEAFAWDARHLLVESVAAGSTGLMMWNLALDSTGGPRDRASQDGCASCRGLLTIDGSEVEPGPEFYVLAHLSHAADPGARVVASSATRGLLAVAFSNPDGSVGVVAHNETGEDRTVAVDVAGGAEQRREVRTGELLTVRVQR